MGNDNRKANDDEMTHAVSVIREAFPDCEVVFGGSCGRRNARDHTISFRIRDQYGTYRSNVVWILPQHLKSLNVSNVRKLVAASNGATNRKKKKR